jgi:hypothetical protein
MKNKKLFGVMTLLAVVMMVFALAGCGDLFNIGTDSGDGWPKDKVLSDFGLKGMKQPAGVTNPSWATVSAVVANELVINFDATSATDAAVNSWLKSNGWSGSGDGDADTYGGEYTKGKTQAEYGRSGTSGTLIVVKTM